jgi:hypothetical protein
MNIEIMSMNPLTIYVRNIIATIDKAQIRR